MTLLSYLQSLRYSNGSSVLVSRGALSTEEEKQAERSGLPYLMLFGLPDFEVDRFLGGGKEMGTVLDIVLEQRPINGQVPDIAEIQRLYNLAGDAPEHVTELVPDVLLTQRLEYIGGLGRPEQKFRTPDWLIAGLSFQATFQTRF